MCMLGTLCDGSVDGGIANPHEEISFAIKQVQDYKSIYLQILNTVGILFLYQPV
jgi:hypothetical protein